MTRSMLLLLLSLGTAAHADAPGTVLPISDEACTKNGFKPHELCFVKPKDEIARAEFLSEPFYAIILKTAAPCSITEAERLETQRLFPRRKVFSMRFYCGDDIEENIGYTNVDDKFGFLAVYAGLTSAQANALLAEIKAAGKFPGANIRKMQARLISP